MELHADVWVLSGTNSDRDIAQRTVRSHSVMLSLVVLWTLVSLDFEVLLAKGQFTMLAFKWEEIDEETRLV